MAKGLDVGTSFIVLAQDAAANSTTDPHVVGNVQYKDFRDAFYVIKPTTPVATKMIEKGLQGKVFVKDADGSFIILGQDAIEKAVERMMPKESPLARKQLAKLRVYAGPSHPHEAQTPETVDFKSMNAKNSRID
jgi:hypothetical protein